MKQPELFDAPSETLEMSLGRAARDGRLFYSVRQSARILNISEFMAYYRIEMYRLDALLIGGEYRIPYTAIIDTARNWKRIARQWNAMLSMERQMSCSLPRTKTSPVRYADMPAAEANPADWYSLDMLPLPDMASTETWERLIGARPKSICIETGWASCQMIEWPEMYDYMIEREVINLPCPIENQAGSFALPSGTAALIVQPSLFAQENEKQKQS